MVRPAFCFFVVRRPGPKARLFPALRSRVRLLHRDQFEVVQGDDAEPGSEDPGRFVDDLALPGRRAGHDHDAPIIPRNAMLASLHPFGVGQNVRGPDGRAQKHRRPVRFRMAGPWRKQDKQGAAQQHDLQLPDET